MRDMDFLKNLGSETEDNSSGSLINGMTAEEYEASLDAQAENDDDLPVQQPHPSAMGGSLDDLPTTAISDMDPDDSFGAPTGSQPAGSKTNRYGGNTATLPQQSAAQPTGYTASNRYSANSYENNAGFASSTAEPYRPIRERRWEAAASSENIGLGIIGAILGAALGTIVWALIAWAGYISWIGAIAIVAGTFFGYILFAKDIGRGGALVVCVLIVLAVFCGNRLGFAIALHSELQKYVSSGEIVLEEDESVPTTAEIFKDAGYYIDLLGMRSSYNSDMGLSYLFTGVAAAGFFVKRFR